MQEIWKSVEGYEGFYEVSSLGRVKSLKFWKERILKWRISRDWHSQVSLYLNWIKWWGNISRLVAMNFIPNPDNLKCACHKNETLDENGALYNWVDNLFWGTQKDNLKDMYTKWRAKNHFQFNHPFKGKFWKDHSASKPILQYTKSGEFIRKWDCMSDIQRELWINNQNISACYRWLRKSAWGFIWRYSI